jgi:hypothetical protein
MLAGHVTFAEVGGPGFHRDLVGSLRHADRNRAGDRRKTRDGAKRDRRRTVDAKPIFGCRGASFFEHPTGSRRDWQGLNEVQLANRLGAREFPYAIGSRPEAAAFAMRRTPNKIFCPQHFAPSHAALDIMSACLSA